jgi:hypothetical protein
LLGTDNVVFSFGHFFQVTVLCAFHRFVQLTPFILSPPTSVSIFRVIFKAPFGIAMQFAQVSLPLFIGFDF